MSFNPEKITFFAKTDARGKQIPFGIKAKDRQRHMYVVGKTGMGKSTLLENMAAQDIQNGEGMAFIDPHGSAAETLLDYVPEHRLNDVVYFAPFDLANPVSFNVMEDVGPDKRHLVVSGLMSTFKKIWVDAWSARMEYILTNALLALIEYPDTTLLSVNRLFSDKAYRKQVVDYIKDPAVKAFWTEEFANYTDRFAAEALPAIQNKIGQFTGNPLIRNIIGQPHSSFDIRKIMDEKKILIMNLSKGLVGETNANLLGSMLTTRIYLAAMSRADLPVEQMRTMPNFYFYVDEFQSFANATFANILSEARKYHLNLIIAHQYIEQMEEDVRNAVFGNVGTTIAFRVGPFDAEVLETVFSPRFLATDLVNLGFAQIYLTLMIDGIGSQPFSAITLPPVERPHLSCKQMVIAASRQNYARPREAVEKLVTDLHTPVKIETLPLPKKNPAAPVSAQVAPKPPVSNGVHGAAKAMETKGEYKPNEAKRDSAPKTESTPQQERNAAEAQKRIIDRAHKEKRSDPEVRPRATPPVRSTLDLKAVLAKLSAEEQTKKSNIVPKDGQSTKAVTKDSAEGSANLRSALAEALKQVEVKVPTAASATSTAPASKMPTAEATPPAPREEYETAQTPPTPTPTPTPAPVTTPTASVAEAARAELERLADEAEAAFRTLESAPEVTKVPPASTIENDDPLAPKKIERLFKQSGQERSPFAS